MRAAGLKPGPEAIPTSRRTRRRFALLVFVAALGWSGWLAHLHIAGQATPLDYLEAAATDLRMRLAGPRTPPNDVVIVAIDDAIVRREGGFPVSRATMARLIEAIATAQPRALAVDVLFLEDGRQPEADRALAAALRKLPAVLAAAAVFGEATNEGASRSPPPCIARSRRSARPRCRASSTCPRTPPACRGTFPLLPERMRALRPLSSCAQRPWRSEVIRF
ncbi:CHASE2 domain-containing protein [Methylobacterium tardum]|uniref:CHASE2 domain-containing protein n=1 Tax=Methylobacterium tardum TaxID=374432 RepID=UPI00360ED12F